MSQLQQRAPVGLLFAAPPGAARPEADSGLSGLPAGLRTLARLGTAVEVGAALPNSIQDTATRSKVPKTIAACREWVQSGRSKRP